MFVSETHVIVTGKRDEFVLGIANDAEEFLSRLLLLYLIGSFIREKLGLVLFKTRLK